MNRLLPFEPESPSDIIPVHTSGYGTRGAIPTWVIDRPQDSYFGCLESEYGDLWVIIATADCITMSGGYLGWEQVHLLKPSIEMLNGFSEGKGRWPTHIPLDKATRSWVSACLRNIGLRFSYEREHQKGESEER